ncbi:DNA repair protein XRCC4-like [Patiria miniata]|uniref:XRCC4 n=1 Tax=Patiria miniata TaxID=46514 RepID=A0A913ZMU7_PATMI|nr:DNA repair protein XRCC4-like [Patiria miniata]XP_038053068.1 DNA repair protein XRCC4-like [Patiria miniata]
MPGQTLCRIDVGRQPYFLQTTAKNGGKDGFDLVMTDAVNSWEGQISRQRLTQLAKKVNMSLEEFTEHTQKALTRQDMGELAFEYHFKTDANKSEFSWKKVMSNENIKFQLGSVALDVVEDSAESIQDLFIFTIDNAASLRDNIRLLEGENERLSTERANALKRLEKCVGMHEEMEKELFSKFQVVLNDKKAKIRRLKQEANSASANNSAKQRTQDIHSSGEESNHEQTVESEGEEVSTDEESKAAKRPPKRTGPSKRVDQDSSLILGEEPTNEAAPGGKRRRRREVTNKQTPSKPTVPKVSSGRTERSATPSTPGTSETGRLSRTTSSRSSKSDPDADMLFDEL